jgi:DNA-binding XRE family transcriptional regulator
MQYTLKELRARKNLTQQNMADFLGISRQRYIEIEKRPSTVSCEKMSVIAEILEVKLGDIYLHDYHTNCEVD